MGRPRKYASDAERQKAFRSRVATKCFNTEPETAATIEKLAVMFEVTDSFVVNSLVKFALLNRNWPAHGMIYWRSARKSDSRGRRKSDLKPGTGGDDGEE